MWNSLIFEEYIGWVAYMQINVICGRYQFFIHTRIASTHNQQLQHAGCVWSKTYLLVVFPAVSKELVVKWYVKFHIEKL